MSAPLFVIDAATAAAARPGSETFLSGSEGRHAVSVARLVPGERLDLGDGAGRILGCVVERVEGSDRLVARVAGIVDVPQSSPRVVVVQGLPKGDRGEAAVQTLTEVGVDEIVPWAAERSVARWVGDRTKRGREKWAQAARAAGKQSRRAWFPQVGELADSGVVESRIRRAVTAMVLHEEASLRLHGVNLPATGEVLIIVGPEGGISPAELLRFTEAGAVAVRLGPSVLRTSTAGTVAAGIILSRTARWA
jgi:16S rRNA (uracil1498-N3)-methyltransferase